MYIIKEDFGHLYYHCGACGAHWCLLDDDLVKEFRLRYCYMCGHEVLKEVEELFEPEQKATIEKSVLDKLADILKEVKGDG